MSQVLWPIHLKPKIDELITSWLSRLAMAYSMSYRQFCAVAFGRAFTSLPISRFAGDLDIISDQEFFTCLATKTGTTIEKVESTTLTSYQKSLGIADQDRRRLSWILSSERIQFCARCLIEDESPYYRRKWRLAFITACETHHIRLSDACPNCNSNISYRRSLSKHSYESPFFSIVFCHSCSTDLRDSGRQIEVNIQELKFQALLYSGLQKTWVDLASSHRIFSQQYFLNLRKLARSLTTGRNAQLLQKAIAETYKIDPSLIREFQGTRDQIERLAIQQRRVLMTMIGFLMGNWPVKPIGYFQGKDSYSRSIFKEVQDINADFSQKITIMA